MKKPPSAPTLPLGTIPLVKGFVNGCTPVQHVAVRYLAAGWDIERVAEELKVKKGVVKKWFDSDPAFQRAYQEAVVTHTEVVEALLLVGEREAARTLIEALAADKGDKLPNWPVRVQAAMSLMDRAGTRGRAIERQQVAQVTANIKANAGAEDALRKALRDPGVRSWLKETGQMSMVEAEVLQIEAPKEPTIEINYYTEQPSEDVA